MLVAISEVKVYGIQGTDLYLDKGVLFFLLIHSKGY